MTMASTPAVTKVLTGEAILSYPNFAKPRVSDEGKETYGCALVFLKATDKKPFQKALMAAARETFGEKVKVGKAELTLEQAFASKDLAWPIREGEWEKKGYPEGSFFINVRSSRRPGCVFSYASKEDPTKAARIPDEQIEDELYPGCIVRATINAYGYDRKGKKGVTFGLNNVQKLREGERIDGRAKAEDEFTVDLQAVNIEDLTS